MLASAPRNSSSPTKRRSGVIIKKELSPIDVDMLSSGNKGSPIYIESDSTTSDEEVDAQMDQDQVVTDGQDQEPGEDNAEGEEEEEKEKIEDAEDKELDVKEERYSSPLEYEDPPIVKSTPLFAPSYSDELEQPEEPIVENSVALPSPEPSEHPANELAHDASEPLAEEPVTTPLDATTGDIPKDASREPTRELSAEPPDSDKAADEPPAQSTVPGTSHDAYPAKETRFSTPPARVATPPSSPSPTPDPKMAPFFDLVRPRPKPKMKAPPATQPLPDTRKRPFASVDADVTRSPSPKPTPKRRDFFHVPASQPAMSVTAPVRGSVGSSSTAVSQRALTIESGSSEPEERKSKRAKTSRSSIETFKVPVSQPKPVRRPTKHPDHWHTDGSVILSFQNIAFRLHRSRLSQQSTLLSELFHGAKDVVEGGKDELKVKASREGNMDGKPLFIIDGVSPDDFDKMLKAADNAIMFVFQPPSFAELASILRASLALDFPSLSNFATHALTSMWPSALPSHHTPIGGSRDHAEETIVLARTCSLPSLLKRAFYELLRAPGLGQQLDDEFMLAGDDDAWARRKIGRTDLVRLVRTREELASQWARGAALPPDPRDFPCPLTAGEAIQGPSALELLKQCEEARQQAVGHWRDLVLNSDLYVEHMNDPIEGLERLAELNWEERGFCPGCVESWRTSWRRQREKVWANLDLWLELPHEEKEDDEEEA